MCRIQGNIMKYLRVDRHQPKEVLEPFWTILVFPMFYVLETKNHRQGASQGAIRMIREQNCGQPICHL